MNYVFVVVVATFFIHCYYDYYYCFSTNKRSTVRSPVSATDNIFMVCDCLSKKWKFVLEFSPLVDTNVRCFSLNNCKCVINDSIVKHILSEVDISFLFLDKAILYHLNVQTLNWKKGKHFCLIRTCVTHFKTI